MPAAMCVKLPADSMGGSLATCIQHYSNCLVKIKRLNIGSLRAGKYGCQDLCNVSWSQPARSTAVARSRTLSCQPDPSAVEASAACDSQLYVFSRKRLQESRSPGLCPPRNSSGRVLGAVQSEVPSWPVRMLSPDSVLFEMRYCNITSESTPEETLIPSAPDDGALTCVWCYR